MIRAVLMALIVFIGIGLAGVADATVTISGTFSGEDSFGCYPATIEVSPQSQDRDVIIVGAGVVFYSGADIDCVDTFPSSLAGLGIAGVEGRTFRINVGRDRLKDTRVDALFIVGVDGVNDDQTLQRVSFTDLLPSIKIEGPFLQHPMTRFERHGCYELVVSAYPETMAVVLNVASSVTNRIPDLEFFVGRDCQTPITGPLALPAGRYPDGQIGLTVRHSPRNAGNAGTILVTADPSFTVAGQSYPPKATTIFFDPRTPLTLTAPATTNLDANGCYPATVRVGASDLSTIDVRVYSGTGNARVYSSGGCLTTLSSFKLAPNTSRTVWIKPVAPDVSYASLVADSTNAGNVEVTRPPAAGVTFYFTP